jgi:beta-glucosidase-like glycosyl hydrolase
VRNVDLVSVFPAGITTGATFNRDLMYTRGYALGQEFRGKGANVALAPVAGPLGRAPAAGRNWEGFGADPFLAGSTAIKYSAN